MTELGQTNDPTTLVPGNPDAINNTIDALSQYGDLLYQAGEGLKRIDTSAGWSGAAADAFRNIFHGQPAKWLQAGDAFHDAAKALDAYTSTLIWAQQQAGIAINLWNIGKPSHQAAQDTLSQARTQLDGAGNTAATIVGRARDLAPPKPGFWSQLTSDVGSFFSGAGNTIEHVGETALSGLASMGNAAIHNPGSLIETAGGLALAAVSTGGEVGGVALDLTGIGAVLGVPINAVSAAGVTAGLGLAATGMSTIARDAAGDDHVNMMNSQGTSGAGGGGTIGDDPPSEITGRTTHGDDQAQSRDGHGISDAAMKDAVTNPTRPAQAQAGGTYKYTGKNAVVILNQDGKVVTTWARNSAGWRTP